MTADPLVSLRAYRQLAPWNLKDLTTLTATLLETAGVRPMNRAAAALPTERTIRYYVTRNLVAAPDGRGTTATYGYRHFLQVLAVKLRQMEGATLGAIARELRELTGDVLERRVATALGERLPPPDRLPVPGGRALSGGRAGRVYQVAAPPLPTDDPTAWHRIPVGPGAELMLRTDHPLADAPDELPRVGDAVRLSLGRLVTRRAGSS